MTDRLGDLWKGGKKSDHKNYNQITEETNITIERENNEIKAHHQKYEEITKGLEQIRNNVAEIEKLKEKDGNIANETKRKENMATLENVITETNGIGKRLKGLLDVIKRENIMYEKEHPKDYSKNQMRTNLYQTNVRRFHQIWNEYNGTSQDFKRNLRERTIRQLKIVDNKISDDDARRIVDSGRADGVIKQALISENLGDVIKDIEERHADILKLEKQVAEVFQLFQDLATLVDVQQESLDIIADRIEKAKVYAEKAEIELKSAEVYTRKSKRRKCIILICMLAILLFTLVPLLSELLPKM